MKILIMGSGAYVLEDAFGPGVILRSVLAWAQRKSTTVDVTLSVHNAATIPAKQNRVRALLEKWCLPNDFVKLTETPNALNQLKKDQYDAVFIAVPDKHHATYIKNAAEVDCPCWVVKPLTGNLPDLTALNNAGIADARLWIDYHKRLDPSNQALKDCVDTGQFGRMLSYQVDYQQPLRLPLLDFSWSKDVDPFTYIGCHYVDQIFYLFPEAVLSSVDATPLKGLVYQEINQPDMISAHLTFDIAGHVLAASMQVGWCLPNAAPLKSQQRVVAQFERGTVTLDQARRGVEVWSEDGVSLQNPYFFREYKDFDGNWMVNGYGYQSVARFLDLAKSGRSWPTAVSYPLFKEAAKTESVLEAVRKAYRSR